jgi:GntR family transcriptional regulator/MocR family aminotransferase
VLLELAPGVGRRDGLERALREAIRLGRLAPGTRIPPSRTLARDLGIARGTVVEAYSQLVAEGYLAARQGAGTVVTHNAHAATAPAREPAAAAQPMFDFHPGVPDPTAFPTRQWLRALRRALVSAPPSALGYGDPRGAPELRDALASYLARARGVVTSPAAVVTVPGFMRGLALLCVALQARGARRIAMENPCIFQHRDGAKAAGLEIVPMEVDEQGARVDVLERSGADVALVTPAHQFPLGATLSPERRAALVEWARAGDRLVIEDDYDGEFRYDRLPVGALQALDPDRIVYAGTASKTLVPGLRIAWLALPEWLTRPIVDIKKVNERQLPFTDELALAELIESGDWDRHVRRMRGRHRARRDRFAATLAESAPSARAIGISAGLHAVVELPGRGPTEKELVTRARGRSIGLFPLGPFWHRPRRRPQALVVGYGSPPEHRYEAALRELGDVLSVVG